MFDSACKMCCCDRRRNSWQNRHQNELRKELHQNPRKQLEKWRFKVHTSQMHAKSFPFSTCCLWGLLIEPQIILAIRSSLYMLCKLLSEIAKMLNGNIMWFQLSSQSSHVCRHAFWLQFFIIASGEIWFSSAPLVQRTIINHIWVGVS